jgi:hypothetical protein
MPLCLSAPSLRPLRLNFYHGEHEEYAEVTKPKYYFAEAHDF